VLGRVDDWHDLVLYLIARYAERRRAGVARLFALQWHQDGSHLHRLRRQGGPRRCEIQKAQQWLSTHFSVARPSKRRQAIETRRAHVQTTLAHATGLTRSPTSSACASKTPNAGSNEPTLRRRDRWRVGYEDPPSSGAVQARDRVTQALSQTLPHPEFARRKTRTCQELWPVDAHSPAVLERLNTIEPADETRSAGQSSNQRSRVRRRGSIVGRTRPIIEHLRRRATGDSPCETWRVQPLARNLLGPGGTSVTAVEVGRDDSDRGGMARDLDSRSATVGESGFTVVAVLSLGSHRANTAVFSG